MIKHLTQISINIIGLASSLTLLNDYKVALIGIVICGYVLVVNFIKLTND